LPLYTGMRRQLSVAVAVGLFSAVVIPFDRPGLGWILAFGVLAGLIAWRNISLWAGAAIVLIALSSLRSAGWVFALCLIAAIMLLAVAVHKGRSWSDIGLALPRWVHVGGRSGLGAVRDLGGSDRLGPVRVLRGVGIGVALVLLFGALLSSADVVFAGVVRDLFASFRPARIAVGTAIFLVVAGLSLAALRLRGLSAADPEDGPKRTPWNRLDWAIPLGLLNALFATFAVVQFTVLFGGHRYVLEDGPTYAQYARSGFAQLAVVTTLTLLVVAAVLARVSPRDLRLVRGLAGALCLLTLVIVASALRRTQVYAEAFGFTRMRLLSAAFIIWLGMVFVLIIAVGLWSRRALMPQLVLGSAVIVLLGLVAVNPDRYVAQTVIGRYEKDGHLDAPYLTRLSPDALAAIERLPEPKRSCIASRLVPDADPWYAFNPARAHARRLKLSFDEDACNYYLLNGYRLEGNWINPD
jgi:Domain of unknown function (DUF4153)